VYEADYVVNSFSLGVMQSKAVVYSPELPEWKLAAIHDFVFTSYTILFSHLSNLCTYFICFVAYDNLYQNLYGLPEKVLG
jgi:hypothetical protein